MTQHPLAGYSVARFNREFELGLNVPEPADKEFVAKVRRHLAEAEQWELPDKPKPKRKMMTDRPHRDMLPPARPTTNRGHGDTCSRCGCDVDERTPGCVTCSNRHAWRRWYDKHHRLTAEEDRSKIRAAS